MKKQIVARFVVKLILSVGFLVINIFLLTNVQAFDFFWCSCTYKETGSKPGKCLSEIGELGLKEGGKKDLSFGGANTSVSFGVKDDCYGSVKFTFDNLVEEGKLCEANCQLLGCLNSDTDEEGNWAPTLCEKLGKMKWISAFGLADAPIDVKFGEKSTKQLEATGAAGAIKFSCADDDCKKVAEINESSGEVVFDTSKLSIEYLKGLKDPKKPLVFIKVKAEDSKDPNNNLSSFLYYRILLPDCESFIKGLDCDKDPKICKTPCEASGDCEFVGDECKEKAGGGQGTDTAAGDTAASAVLTAEYLKGQYPVPPGYEKRGGVLPTCAFDGSCRKTNDLVELLVNFGKAMFAIMGSFAFAFFVYGGFTMIMSMGNAEKQKKGQQILVAAVIGIVIAFSAYMLINFMLSALDVAPDFRGIKSN